jgi:hypothetical protein
MVRQVVYLDHSVISNLAKNHDTEIWRRIAEIVDADKAIFPWSAIHAVEAGLDTRLEAGIRQAGASLSRGLEFLPYPRIAGAQAKRAYVCFVRGGPNDCHWKDAFLRDPRGSIPEGLMRQVVHPGVISHALERSDRRRRKQHAAESLETQRAGRARQLPYAEAQREYAKSLVGLYLMNPRFGPPEPDWEIACAMRQYSDEMWVEALRTQLLHHESMLNFFAAPECREIPFIAIEASILASLEVDTRSRPYSPSDFYDIVSWSSYLPYLDHAVADRHMHQVLTRRNLAGRFACTVYPNTEKGLDDLCRALEESD